MARRSKDVAALGAGAIVLLVADVFTKVLTHHSRDSRFLHPQTNSRLALGVGGPIGIVTAVFTAGIAITLLVAAGRQWWSRGLPTPALAAVVAGLCGNLGDRLVTGAVHDWLVVGRTAWNLADLCLLVGIASTLISIARRGSAPASSGRRQESHDQPRTGGT